MLYRFISGIEFSFIADRIPVGVCYIRPSHIFFDSLTHFAIWRCTGHNNEPHITRNALEQKSKTILRLQHKQMRL